MTYEILVVDDEDDIRMVLRMMLEAEGHTVVEAASGREGLEAIDRHDPDLVFLDLRMPEMDGWAVLDELRASGRLDRLPVVVVSAHASPGTSERALSLGCRDYISKPFTPDDLAATIERVTAPGDR